VCGCVCGGVQAALDRFEQALATHYMAAGRTVTAEHSAEHVAACTAGTARMHVKLGNAARGVAIATACGESVCRECAAALEGLKQYADAAALYEKWGPATVLLRCCCCCCCRRRRRSAHHHCCFYLTTCACMNLLWI
jgi:hypothetical protein